MIHAAPFPAAATLTMRSHTGRMALKISTTNRCLVELASVDRSTNFSAEILGADIYAKEELRLPFRTTL